MRMTTCGTDKPAIWQNQDKLGPRSGQQRQTAIQELQGTGLEQGTPMVSLW